MTRTPVVVAENLSFAYPSQVIFDKASLSVREGEFVGMIGPNGGGKTTLLKLIMGFYKPTAGRLSIFGTEPRAARREMAWVPQNLQYDRQFPITVMELVLGGCLIHSKWWGGFQAKEKRIAQEAIARVGLADFAQRPFGTLSGGQAQRALIARALASQPKLLLLDEPTASVDAQAEEAIYAILEELKGTMTLMMVTHDLNAIVPKMDRILCIQHGIEALTPSEVCEHYALGLYHAPLIPNPKAP